MYKCEGCGRIIDPEDEYTCKECGRKGCSFCMPDGPDKSCPQCEAGGMQPLQTEG